MTHRDSGTTRLLLVAGLAIPMVGVAGAAQSSIRDSAGVRIVETSASMVQTWTVAATPQLTIGVVDGAAPYQFNRISTAFRLSDGGVIVADGGTGEFRYFATDGRHVRTVGRRGSGPGETRAFSTLLLLPGDSLLVYDATLGRLTTFTPTGSVARTIPAARFPDMSGTRAIGRMADGKFAAMRRIPYPLDGRTSFHRESLLVVITMLDGAKPDTVAKLPSTEIYAFAPTPPSVGGPAYTHPFGYSADVTTWNGQVVTGTREGYELKLYDATGRLRSIIRRTDAPRMPLDGPRVNTYIAAVARVDGAEGAERHRAQLDWFPGPRFVPSYGGFWPDNSGNLWVRDFPSPDPPRSRARADTWVVFAADGRAVARVTTPVGFETLSISEQHLVGRMRDSLNVEYVQVYSLQRANRR